MSAFSAEDFGQSNQMNIIHPFCGRSEGFANHRQPKLALFTTTTTSRHGRIINGIESNPNAWPWQVRNIFVFLQDIEKISLNILFSPHTHLCKKNYVHSCMH